MASELQVTTLRGNPTGANANKVIIPSGETLDASNGLITPAGQVLQVITKNAGGTANTISTTSYTAVGLDINITPKRSGSHFLYQAFWLVYKNGNGLTLKVESAMFRASTNISGNLTHTPYIGANQGDQHMPFGGISQLDTGANAIAGTPISYSYRFKKNATGEISYDVAHNDAKSAFLTIMEIAQ